MKRILPEGEFLELVATKNKNDLESQMLTEIKIESEKRIHFNTSQERIIINVYTFFYSS
jgi:hypothetical protein